MRKLLILFICFSCSVSQLIAQRHAVNGKVTDGRGNPIPNVSVLIKGTTIGTATEQDGTFSISVPASAKVLVFSSLSYVTIETIIEGKDFLNVSLVSSNQNLDEVLVVAYGTQKKTNITGSVATIKAADIADKPFSSVDKALQGAVAGLQSTSASGAPGSGTDIRIRGIGSITASASPLWVIDGVISSTGDFAVNTTTTNALSSINPDDIESITVLKDASATSLYGSRASNGVILVTTKRGKSGKTKISLTTEIGKNDIAFKNNNNRPMTTAEYQTILRQGVINAGLATTNSGADSIIVDPANGFGLKPGVSTNWLKQVTQKGSQQQYNLSASGGSEKTQIYISGGYFKQLGTIINTDFERYNGSLSITHKAYENLTLSAGISGSSSTQHTPSNGGAFANPVISSYFLLPWYSPYNADGSLKYKDAEGQFPLNGGVFNPLVQVAYNKGSAKQADFRGYLTGELQIINDLKFTSRFSSEFITYQEDQYRNPFYGDGYANGGDAYSAYTRIFDYTWDNFLDYKKALNKGKDIYFDVKAGYETQRYKYYSLQAGGKGFPQTLALQYLASTATPSTATALPSESSTDAYFSSADINYKDRYVLTGSFRRDGSSVFSANHRYGNFYSVGGTWNVSEEDFIKNSKSISLLKLRGSYGTTGNALGFGLYSSLPTYGYGNNYGGLAGSAPNNVGNIDLTWETNKILDFGLDMAFFKNRLSVTFDWYDRKTSNLLLNVPLSLTSGFAGQNQNVGSLDNKGVELSLSGKPIVSKDFTWSVSFNIAHNKNRVISLYQHKPVNPGGYSVANASSGSYNYTEGYDLQTFYLRQWAGVDPANGDPLWYTDSSHASTTNTRSKAALVLDPKYTSAPKLFGSFINTFTYKNISLNVQFNYNFGNYVFDRWGLYTSSEGAYLGSFNQYSQELKAWQKSGDITNIPKIIYGGNKLSYTSSTRFLYKGDYIRLRDIELSYSIPQALIKSMHISNISIYARGTNLITFATDKNIPFDPETGVLATGNLDVFIPKSVTFGLKVGL